jgi:hypothetical protein
VLEVQAAVEPGVLEVQAAVEPGVLGFRAAVEITMAPTHTEASTEDVVSAV